MTQTPPHDPAPELERRCPQCGAAVPPDAPAGGCPGCLVEAALDPGPPEGVPSRDSLAELFPELEIQALLGRGGMGAVFRARQTKLERTVALKVLPPQEGARGVAFADRFTREARALARLDHPHIVRVFEFGERQGLYFLVMEYVDGVNLREAMQDGDIAPRQALAIVPQICDALQFAHDSGVVHRDIKPENVLLTKEGTVKVADFGLAKILVGATEDATLTRAGQVMGTVHYMAPEQVESPASVDHRADIYSLGVVFYEMLTGELPVGRFDPPSHRARVDARLDEVVMRALERKRERRYQKVSEVKTAVSGIDDPGSGGPAALVAPGEPRKTSMPALLSPVMLPVALVAAVLAAFAASHLGANAHGKFVAAASTIGTLGLLAILFGIAGIFDTRGSGRTGRWMAIVGLVAALVWTPALSASSFYALDVQESQRRDRERRYWEDQERQRELSLQRTGLPDSMRGVVPHEDPEFVVTADDATTVSSTHGAALKSRLNYLLGAAAGAIEAENDLSARSKLVLAEYDDLPSDPEELAAGRSRGAFGPAFLDPATLTQPLDRFKVVSAHVKSAMSRSGGLAIARLGPTELTFGFAYDHVRMDWFLTIDAVSIRTVEAPPASLIRVFHFDGTGISKGEDSVNAVQIGIAFRNWRESPYDAAIAMNFVRDADHPFVQNENASALPIAPGVRDDPRRARLEITEIRYTDHRQLEAMVTAESGDGRVVFPMSGTSRGWSFGAGNVSVEWFEDGGR